MPHTYSMTLDGYKAAIDREAVDLRTTDEVVTVEDAIDFTLACIWCETRKPSLRTADAPLGLNILRHDLLPPGGGVDQTSELDGAFILELEGIKVPRLNGDVGASSTDREGMGRND
eukprot:scaffold111817_cov18-Prasinocladus_malaysianus.AAC.3